MQTDESTLTAKMVILGDQGVGKTSLITRYVEKKFDRFSMPTLGASYFSCSLGVRDRIVKLQIWDTAGHEKFKALAPMFYRNANGAILVYDITRPESFENIKNWVKELQRAIEIPMVLCIVGSKLDLSSERKVFTDDAVDYANSIGASYHECSALKDQGIDPIFQKAALELAESSNEILTNTRYKDGRVVIRESRANLAHGDAVKNNCC